MLYILNLNDVEIVESGKAQLGVILDHNSEGKVLGLEILNVSSGIKPKTIKNFTI